MTNNMLGEKLDGNYMLDIKTRVGEETQSNIPCMAYAIDEEDLIFAAFMGAQTANQAVKALGYEKGFLQFSRSRTKAYLPKEAAMYKWHYAAIDSINKGCSYVMVSALEMVTETHRRTYVMDKIGNKDANHMHPDTVTLIGQRIKEVSNAPLLPEWYSLVVKYAREFPDYRNPLVSLANCQNCRVWRISKDGDQWAKLICSLLEKHIITISETE